MSKSHASEFSAQYNEQHFPSELLSRYVPIELLSDNEHNQTILLKEKKSGQLTVAKRYNLSNSLADEDILSNLSHDALPVFIERIEVDGCQYIICEYVEGVALDQYAKWPLAEHEAVNIVQKMCDVLAYLHDRTPPVIHRDIKPSNIIINPKTNKITLIDFGISRKYSQGAKNDTVYMGTQNFSPPEQYGFSQTDRRADIYALGMVFCWLLTGQSGAGAAAHVNNSALRKIINRCTAFDPQKRYANVSSLKRNLNSYNKRHKNRIIITAAALLTALLLFSAGFIIGQYTKISIPVFNSIFAKNEVIVFNDSILEQRVRENMNMQGGDITAAMAHEVTTLDLSSETPQVLQQEKITDISVLVYFDNLTKLYLDWNDISDISPLENMKTLEVLYLNGNGNISDFSPLENLVDMKDIMFVGCPIDHVNVQACAKMTKLESFWVESPQLSDISIVSNFPGLKKLTLKNCRIRDISPLEELKDLVLLDLQENPVSDLSALLGLPRLGTVNLTEDLRALAKSQLSDADFEIVYK